MLFERQKIKRLESFYRIEKGYFLIEMKYGSIKNIFNTIDPSPILDKDLNDSTADYITSSVQELGTDKNIKIIFYLPGNVRIAPWTRTLTQVLHNYYEYKSQNELRTLKFLLAEGRISFLIGIVFLIICVLVGEFIPKYDQGTLGNFAKEGLLIGGWVAMWKPVQLLLYDWWPILRKYKVYKKLCGVSAEVRKIKI